MLHRSSALAGMSVRLRGQAAASMRFPPTADARADPFQVCCWARVASCSRPRVPGTSWASSWLLPPYAGFGRVAPASLLPLAPAALVVGLVNPSVHVLTYLCLPENLSVLLAAPHRSRTASMTVLAMSSSASCPASVCPSLVILPSCAHVFRRGFRQDLRILASSDGESC